MADIIIHPNDIKNYLTESETLDLDILLWLIDDNRINDGKKPMNNFRTKNILKRVKDVI